MPKRGQYFSLSRLIEKRALPCSNGSQHSVHSAPARRFSSIIFCSLRIKLASSGCLSKSGERKSERCTRVSTSLNVRRKEVVRSAARRHSPAPLLYGGDASMSATSAAIILRFRYSTADIVGQCFAQLASN